MIQSIPPPKCFIGASRVPGPWWWPWPIRVGTPFAKLCVSPGRATLAYRWPYSMWADEIIIRPTTGLLVTWSRAAFVHADGVWINSPDHGLLTFWTGQLAQVLNELKRCGFSVRE